LQQLIEEKQMTARVHFRPYQKEVQTFYQAIDVFAMASHGETYGLVTLEAMYFQKPVIGVNTDGTKALLEDGKLGWLYELEDINEFQQQLQTIFNHPKATEEIVAKAHRQIVAKYVFENTVREMDALFKNYLAAVPA
jgi:glycosyltransferase involved in cell wall biosynthesis